MKTLLPLLGLVSVVCLGGCQKLTIDRFGRTAEWSGKPEALTVKEVLFRVRMRLPASELQEQLARRGLAEPLSQSEESQLMSYGASEQLIALLRSSDTVLTKAERELYGKRSENRKTQSDQIQAEEDAGRESRLTNLKVALNNTNKDRVKERVKDLKEKRAKLVVEQQKTQCTNQANTPYQRLKTEIAEVDKEISAANEQLDALNGKVR